MTAFKGLLGLDAAQIAVGVAAVYVSIGVGVRQRKSCMALSPSMSWSPAFGWMCRFWVVVVVHVDGHIKLYAADGIHQLAHASHSTTMV